MTEICGYSNKEMIGKSIFSLISEVEARNFKNRLENRKNDISEKYEVKINCKYGKEIHGKIEATLLYDEGGNYDGAIVFIEDITEKRRDEQLFRESEEKFRILIKALTQTEIGVDIVDLNHNVIYQNDFLRSRFGNHSGRKCYEHYLGRKNPCKICPMKKAIKTNKVEKERISGPENRIYEITSAPLSNNEGRIDRAAEVIIDVTKRAQIEQKLRDSEESYRFIVENAQEGIWSIDAKGNTTYANRRMAEILGYTVEAMIGKNLLEFMDKEGEKIAKEKLERRKKGIKEQHDFEFLRKDGTKIYTILEASPIIGIDGDYKGAFAFVSDITERRRIEVNLKESEQRYRTVIQDQTELIVRWRTNGILTFVNDSYCNYFQKTKEELIGTSFLQLIPDEDHELMKRNFSLITVKNPIMSHEHRVFKPDGTVAWINWTNRAIIDENSKIIEYQSVGRDITGKRRAEQKLKESEEKYRSLFENSPIGLMDQDFSEVKRYVDQLKASGINDFNKFFKNHPDELLKIMSLPKIIDVNRRTIELYGARNKEEFILKMNRLSESIENSMTEELFLYNKMEILSLINGGTMYDSEIETKSFTEDYLCIYAKTSIVTGFESTWSKIIVSIVDITKRKKIEENLQREYELNKNLIQASPAYYAAINTEGKTILINDVMLDVLGYKLEEVLNEDYLTKFVPEREQELMWNEFSKLIENRKPALVINHILTKTGQELLVEWHGRALFKNNGEFDYLFGFGIDITERAKAEKKLKESEEKYRNLVETSSMALFEFDFSINELAYINPKLLEIIGYKYEELIKEKYYQNFIHPEDLREMELSRTDKKLEFRVLTKDGKVKWLSGNRLHFYDEEGNLTYVRLWLQDITEQKSLEEIKANLLMRFSHEFKTPLISIKGFADLLLEDYRDELDKKIISFLENIKNGADKLKNLTNTFLESSHLDGNLVRVKIKQVDVSILINRVLSELEGIIKSRKHIVDLKIEKPSLIKCDPEKIHVIISNLILNAAKFTPRGGLITISAITKNGFFIISVKDNGIGLPKVELENLFRPFGKIERYGQGLDIVPDGIGMGLFITKGLVELHKGKIWAESSGRNQGSTFIVKIPLNQ